MDIIDYDGDGDDGENGTHNDKDNGFVNILVQPKSQLH